MSLRKGERSRAYTTASRVSVPFQRGRRSARFLIGGGGGDSIEATRETEREVKNANSTEFIKMHVL